jgi:two-component system, chemotaxis family, sensor kinase CheA
MKDFSTQDFLEDFLQESSEHLQSIKSNLLALEHTIPHPTSNESQSLSRLAVTEELFRSFHTLKGLSGMVGLEDAEKLSHSMESILRAIQNKEMDVTNGLIDGLLEGTRLVEAVIGSLSGGQFSIDEVNRSLQRLEGLLEDGVPANLVVHKRQTQEKRAETIAQKPAAQDPQPSSRKSHIIITDPEVEARLDRADKEKVRVFFESGKLFYLALFTPHPEKSAAGINVSQIKDKLAQLGEIVKSYPIIDGSSIRFGFLVAAEEQLDRAEFPEIETTPLSLEIRESLVLDVEEEAGGIEVSLEPAQSVAVFPHPPASMRAAPTRVRVDLNRLDELMRIVSELVIKRSRLMELLPSLRQVVTGAKARPVLHEVEQTALQMDRSFRDLRQAVIRTRMVPLAEVFNHMPLAVRDMVRDSEKKVQLILEGEQTEIDKVLVERLLDPLLHLVRNAITHGIESEMDRISAGKTPEGKLFLRARLHGEQVIIEVEDDGAGIDIERVRERAIARGWIEPDKFPDDAEILSLLVQPNFSTLDQSTLEAGRGVGMEVVNRAIQSVSGNLGMRTKKGIGTVFTLTLPFTLTIMDAIIVRCGKERYAIPQHNVAEVIEIDPSEVSKLEQGELIPYRGSSISLVRLSDLFRIQPEPQRYQYGLIAIDSTQRIALVVDQLIGLREVVVRTMNDPLVSQPGMFGATELGDGKVILIIDLTALLQGIKAISS